MTYSNGKSTRERIVNAADQLFYERGFENARFAQLAETVDISVGNINYHFKTKDSLLQAVISLRLSNTQRMLAEWDAEGEHPADRIRCFIKILSRNRSKILRHGCPLGMLSAELAKLDHAAQVHAKELFTLFRRWLRKQFRTLGRTNDADELAMQLLARSQGVASLASAFNDEAFIRREVDAMCEWLETQTKTAGR